MSEHAITISNLNDFIFCPASIYFHSLDFDTDKLSYQSIDQINGSAAHTALDNATYSTKASVLQGISVYSEQYDLLGKIDVFDTKTGELRERKKKIKIIYDGYVFQLYAQYYALSEMGYCVKKLCLYSLDDNKTYDIPLPNENLIMLNKFIQLINDIKTFSLEKFRQTNCEKCNRCIYEPLCSFSKLNGDNNDYLA